MATAWSAGTTEGSASPPAVPLCRGACSITFLPAGCRNNREWKLAMRRRAGDLPRRNVRCERARKAKQRGSGVSLAFVLEERRRQCDLGLEHPGDRTLVLGGVSDLLKPVVVDSGDLGAQRKCRARDAVGVPVGLERDGRLGFEI